MTLPVTKLILPSDLHGQPNGLIDQVLLTPIGYGGFRMHHLATRARKAMEAALIEAGHVLKSTGTYRTYSQQVLLFDGTMSVNRSATTGRYIPREGWAEYQEDGGKWATPADQKSWRGKLWMRRAGTAMSAVPGTSNHGLGLADDFGEERDGDAGAESVSAALVAWLCANAITYGFSAEAQSEPWHWRYVAGDQVPQAVLDYEQPDPPDPPEDDDDMPKNVYYSNKEARTFEGAVYPPKQIKFRLCDDGKARRVDGEEIADRESIPASSVDLDFGTPKSNQRLDSIGAPN